MLGLDSRCRVSVMRCKPCRNPYKTDEVQIYLPPNPPSYVLHSYSVRSLFIILPLTTSPSQSAHQPVRGRGGIVAVLYDTRWAGLLRPSWQREADVQYFGKHEILY